MVCSFCIFTNVPRSHKNIKKFVCLICQKKKKNPSNLAHNYEGQSRPLFSFQIIVNYKTNQTKYGN